MAQTPGASAIKRELPAAAAPTLPGLAGSKPARREFADLWPKRAPRASDARTKAHVRRMASDASCNSPATETRRKQAKGHKRSRCDLLRGPQQRKRLSSKPTSAQQWKEPRAQLQSLRQSRPQALAEPQREKPRDYAPRRPALTAVQVHREAALCFTCSGSRCCLKARTKAGVADLGNLSRLQQRKPAANAKGANWEHASSSKHQPRRRQPPHATRKQQSG